MKGIQFTGIPSSDELARCSGIPSDKRLKKGRVACIECVQEIPCNPCEGACRFGAITVGEQITSLPVLHEENCVGCGNCVVNCSGLAITILDWTYSETMATIDFPFEYLPLPKEGDVVDAVGRDGQKICDGTIVKILQSPAYEGTTVIRMAIPKEHIHNVRSMKRLSR